MMSQKREQKTCWSCEGHISPEALYCPYCGSDVGVHHAGFGAMSQSAAAHGAMLDQQKETTLFSAEDSEQEKVNLASLYKPPYSPNQRGFGVPNFQEDKASADDFYYSSTPHQTIYSSSQEELGTQGEAPRQKIEVGLWPLLFLSIGANLLTIGLLLFFFSDRGKLTLEWNSYYWFVYCILATPLLMFGWKLLQSNQYHE